MPTTDSNPVYPDAEKYWELVKKTLDEVFQKDTGSADDLRRDVWTSPPDEQWQFYHAEPLDVAADLAGIEEITEEDVQDYRRIADDLNWR